ncbi:MAG: ABC transporter permease [Acidobacteria bacterium]|nr:ABC transporter permease [Acidobacteriota bacterium]
MISAALPRPGAKTTEPASGTPREIRGKSFYLRELLHHRDLLLILAARDITIRYKQSVMGFLWAILMPVLVVGSGLIVMIAFSVMSGKPINKQDVFAIAVKSVPWAFFVSAIRFATNSLTANKELVTKIYFPREILPMASLLANLFDFLIASAVLALALLAFRAGWSIQILWTPLLLVVLIILTAAFSLVLSCANLFFRDVKYLVEVFLTYGIFLVPVFYSSAQMGKYGIVLLLNPVGPLLESLSNTIVLHRSPNFYWLAYSTVWAIFGLALSLWTFRKADRSFAESI